MLTPRSGGGGPSRGSVNSTSSSTNSSSSSSKNGNRRFQRSRPSATTTTTNTTAAAAAVAAAATVTSEHEGSRFQRRYSRAKNAASPATSIRSRIIKEKLTVRSSVVVNSDAGADDDDDNDGDEPPARPNSSPSSPPSPKDDKNATDSRSNSSNSSNDDSGWLNDEMEAVGELKRGAIAARFPEEFSVDSDFLNSQASNVWLPAHLHPEIAPGEFQAWLKKHSTQLSKMENSVRRRKSVLSYSYSPDDQSDNNPPSSSSSTPPSNNLFSSSTSSSPADFQIIGDDNGVRRRNTTAMVRVSRKKTLMERYVDGELSDESPFLVQPSHRPSLKRSKLTNKRRDSTLGRRRRMHSDTVVPSPLQRQSDPTSPSSPVSPDADRRDHVESLTATTSLELSDPPPYNATPVRGPLPSTQDQPPESQQLQQLPELSVSHRGQDVIYSENGGDNLPIDFDFGLDTASAPPDISTGLGGASPTKLSTEEILKQITQEIHELDMKESMAGSASLTAPPPMSSLYKPNGDSPDFHATVPERNDGPLLSAKSSPFQLPASTKPNAQLDKLLQQSQPQQQQPPPPQPAKTSWWQRSSSNSISGSGGSGGGSNESLALRRKGSSTSLSSALSLGKQDTKQQSPSLPDSTSASGGSVSKKAKLPLQISFLRFSRNKSKGSKAKDRRSDVSIKESESTVDTDYQLTGSSNSIGNQDNNDDVSSISSVPTSSSNVPPSSPALTQGSPIPSILTPSRPPPTRPPIPASNRLPIYMERAIYRLAMIKLANTRRPLLQQVLLSNMLFWYLEIINPRSTQQQHHHQHQQQQQQQQQPAQQPYQHQMNPSSASQNSHMQGGYQGQDGSYGVYNNSNSNNRSGSPMPYSRASQSPQQQEYSPSAGYSHQQQQQQPQMHGMVSGYDASTGNPSPNRSPSPSVKYRESYGHGQASSQGRDRTYGNPAQGRGGRDYPQQQQKQQLHHHQSSETMVMRSPQYERQQQKIYGHHLQSNGGSGGDGGSGNQAIINSSAGARQYPVYTRSRSPSRSPPSSTTNLRNYPYSYHNSHHGRSMSPHGSRESFADIHVGGGGGGGGGYSREDDDEEDYDEGDDVPLAMYRSSEGNIRSVIH